MAVDEGTLKMQLRYEFDGSAHAKLIGLVRGLEAKYGVGIDAQPASPIYL